MAPVFQPELLPRLFEPYVTSKHKGTGLGLAIVKKIVEEHGGHLTARNHDSGGAIISVRFPLTQGAGKMTAQYIMVVDDEPDIRQLVSEILEDEGYRVVTAENAAKARELHRSRKPDLILLDIWMPGQDGISLLRGMA